MKRIKLFEEFLNEYSGYASKPSLPSNVADWVKHQGSAMQTSAKKVVGWAAKAGTRITGGTSIGKSPQTLILDIKHQGSEIYINPDGEITFCSKVITSPKEFAKEFEEYKKSTPELRKYFKVESEEKPDLQAEIAGTTSSGR